MQFAAPQALYWLLLALPIMGFFLLRQRRRRVAVPSVMFWEQVYEEDRPRWWWRRLRHVVSLLLQLLLLLLLALALANPVFSWQADQVRTVALVIDNSASMAATDITPSRFAWAKREALKLLDTLRESDQVSVVTTAVPHVELGLTGHRKTIRQTIQELRCTDAPGQLEQAMVMARRLVGGAKNGSVLVLTDQVVQLEEDSDVSVMTCGTNAGNVAITQLQSRRNLDDRLGFQVFVELSNFSDESRQIQLEISLEGNLLDVVPVELAAEEQRRLILDYNSPEGGELIATFELKDALASDNRAVAIVTPVPPQQVVLVSPGSLFLENVLAAIPRIEVVRRDDVPPELPASTILILHRTDVSEIPQGRVMVIDPVVDSNLWKIDGVVADPIVVKQVENSPLMTHVNLRDLTFPGARRVRMNDPHETLAESLDGDPLYLAKQTSDRSLLVLPVDLERSDLPLRTAFPILVANAIAWFQGVQGEMKSTVSTGEVRTLRLPQTANRQWQLVRPDGTTRMLTAGEELVVGPLDQCGLWMLEPQLGESEGEVATPIQIACNLADSNESDVRTVATEASPAGFAGGWGTRPLWLYLVLLAVLGSAVEWYLYQRRWVG